MNQRASVLRSLYFSVLKKLYRYSHFGLQQYRHNERLWPHSVVKRDATGAIRRFVHHGVEIPLANATWVRSTSTGACHLIATGPSINAIDYRAFTMQHVMGVNGAIALADRYDIAFTYYCIVDTGFVQQHAALMDKVLNHDLTLFTTPQCLWHLLRTRTRDQIRCKLFLVEDILHKTHFPACTNTDRVATRYGSAVAVHDKVRGLGFSYDIRAGLFDAGTVAYNALQIVCWLGYRLIYLHGIDMKSGATSERFYEPAGDGAASRLDDVFSTRIEPSFRAAARALDARGIQVFNLSENSRLPDSIFQKISWESLRTTPPF